MKPFTSPTPPAQHRKISSRPARISGRRNQFCAGILALVLSAVPGYSNTPTFQNATPDVIFLAHTTATLRVQFKTRQTTASGTTTVTFQAGSAAGVYDLPGSPWVQTITTTATSGATHTKAQDLGGLTPGSTYHWKVTVVNPDATLNTTTSGDLVFTPLNQAPLAFNDSFHVAAGAQTLSVLSNDDDPDGDALTITSTTNGTHGTAAIGGGGSALIYTPGAGYNGNDNFTYTISDGFGGFATAAVTLTNAAPVANNDAAVSNGEPVVISVLADNGNGPDTDADGDTLTVTGVTDGAHGSVNFTPTSVTYTPTGAFDGVDSFTYTISDAYATAQATVSIEASQPITRIDAETNGEIDGHTIKSLGIPSINESGATAYTAKLLYGTSSVSTIVAGQPAHVVVKAGDFAPDAAGAATAGTFASFKDPVLNANGSVAFIGKSKEGTVSSTAVWTNGSGSLARVALVGGEPEGVAGAHFKSINSIAICGASSSAFDVFYTGAILQESAAGVTALNDTGVWAYDASGNHLLLREGQAMTINAVAMGSVKSFKVLASVTGSAGQGRCTGDTLAVLVGFDTSRQAVLHLRAGATPELAAFAGDPIAVGSLVGWKTFGVPTVGAGGSSAFLASIQNIVGASVTSATNGGIFADRATDLQLVVRKGDVAPLVPADPSATFSSFRDPVYNADRNVAFIGTLLGPNMLTANKTGIWRTDGASALALVARAGSSVDGSPTGPQWGSFTSLALPDNASPVFAAKLVLNTGTGPDLVTTASNSGVWVEDSTGALHKVAQRGDTVLVGGSPRAVTAVAMLGAVSGSPGQGRSYNGQRQLIYRISLQGGIQQIRKVRVP